MALPVIADHFFVTATFQRSDGDAVVNTFCFSNMSAENSPAEFAADLRDLLDTFYGTGVGGGGGVVPELSGRLFALEYVVYDLGVANAAAYALPSLTYRATASTSGSVLPPDCAVVISWRTEKRGPSFRGRTYLGPLGSAVMDTQGRVSAASRTNIATQAGKLIGASLTRKAAITVLSRSIPAATEVVGGYVDDAFDTMRSRDPGAMAKTPIVLP